VQFFGVIYVHHLQQLCVLSGTCGSVGTRCLQQYLAGRRWRDC